MKTRRTIQTIAIEQGHGWHAQLGATNHQFFGQRSAFQKTEGGAGMEFNVHCSVVTFA
jgi:hypothetical protein